MEEKNLLIITGAPCSGKSTVCSTLLKGNNCNRLKTCTTKLFPENNYNFVDFSSFKEKLKNDEFIEHVHINNNIFGLEKSTIYKIEESDDQHNYVITLSPSGALDLMEFIKYKDLKIRVCCIILGVTHTILIERVIRKTLNLHEGKISSENNIEEITQTLSHLIKDIEEFNHFIFYKHISNLASKGMIKLDDVSLLDNSFNDTKNVLYFATKFFNI